MSETASAFPLLRPMHLPELFDRAIQLYRRNFLAFIGIVAIPYIPLIIIQGISAALSSSALPEVTGTPDPFAIFSNGKYWLGFAGSMLFVLLYFFLIQGLATAALTRAIADSYEGQPVGVFSSYGRLGSTGWRLVGTLFWLGLLLVALVVWMLIPCVGWLTGFGLLLFMAWVVVPLVAPIVVLENTRPFASMRRAWDLGRTRFWWLIGYVFILYLLSAIVISGPSFLISYVLRMLALSSSYSLAQQSMWMSVAQTLTSMITGLLYLPLQLSAITVVYFDLRIRSEGLDLALQAAPGAEAGAAQLPAVVPAGSQSPLLTGRDALNFFLLTIACTVGFVLLYTVVFGALMALALAFMPRGVP